MKGAAILAALFVGFVVGVFTTHPLPKRCTDFYYSGPSEYGFTEGDITAAICERRWLP